MSLRRHLHSFYFCLWLCSGLVFALSSQAADSEFYTDDYVASLALPSTQSHLWLDEQTKAVVDSLIELMPRKALFADHQVLRRAVAQDEFRRNSIVLKTVLYTWNGPRDMKTLMIGLEAFARLRGIVVQEAHVEKAWTADDLLPLSAVVVLLIGTSELPGIAKLRKAYDSEDDDERLDFSGLPDSSEYALHNMLAIHTLAAERLAQARSASLQIKQAASKSKSMAAKPAMTFNRSSCQVCAWMTPLRRWLKRD